MVKRRQHTDDPLYEIFMQHSKAYRAAKLSLSIASGNGFFLVALMFAASVLICLAMAGAPFTYPLDDPYIHLSIGRTLALYGVWGVQPSDAAAASSSPLWTLLLAASYLPYQFLTSQEFSTFPLLLNIGAAIALLAAWNHILRRNGFAFIARLSGLLLLWFVVPLTPLALLGMEHVLHILLTTTLVWLCACHITHKNADTNIFVIFFIAALAVAARYETCFAVAPLIGIALWRRKYSVVLALGIGAAIPVIAFGLYWTSHGNSFLPNALLIKGVGPAQMSGVWSLLLKLWDNIGYNLQGSDESHRIFLALAGASAITATLLILGTRNTAEARRSPATIVGLVALSATFIQYWLAAVGWLYRYESWLLALLGLSVLLLSARSYSYRNVVLSRAQSLSICVAAFALVASPRTFTDFHKTVLAMSDQYYEHRVPAMFIKEFYRGKTIMANDIGILTYYGGARVLDIYGLGSNEPLTFMRTQDGYGQLQLSNWAAEQHVSIAIVQPCWDAVYNRLPDNWQLVEIWRVPRNVVFGDRDIAILAVNPMEADGLRAALAQFPMPPAITVTKPTAAEFASFLEAKRNRRHPPNDICQNLNTTT